MGTKIDILSDLIESGKLEDVKKIIEDNPHLLNAKNKEGSTPLKLAVIEGQAKITEWLIQTGARVDEVDEDGGNLLDYAALNGYKNIAASLIKNGIDVNSQVKKGYTPLFFASLKGHKDLIELLVANGADVNIQSKEGMTPLILASGEGHTEIAEYLIDNNAVLETLTGKTGNSALHIAIYKKKKRMVELLIEKGANTELRNEEGKTALMFALEERLIEMAKLLILKGADVNARWPKFDVKGYLENSTPLHYAVFNNHYDLVKLLIGKGAHLDSRNNMGDAPLHYTDSNENLDIAQLLIRKGADVNELDSENWTPLYRAILYQNEKLAKLLIENGSDVHIGNRDNFTPLHRAVEQKLIKTLQMLIEKGADVNAKAKNDTAPIHLAAIKGYKDIADILLERGATLEAKNKDGWTPLKLASDHGHRSLVDFFVAKGANPDIINRDNRSSKEKNRWKNAAWRSERGESPQEFISKMHDKYVRPLDELKVAIDSIHEEGISTVIVSSRESLKRAVEKFNEAEESRLSIVSHMRPYTAHLIEDDSLKLALFRYKNLQKEKGEMQNALIAGTLADARIRGYSDAEIDEKFRELISDRSVNTWNDDFEKWMRLEYEKIKKLVKENPSYKNIECLLKDLLFSDDLEFDDVVDLMNFFKDLPSGVWEEKLLDILESISFEKIWEKDFFYLLKYVDRFHNKAKLSGILNVWEKQLADWIESGKIDKYTSSEKKIFASMFGWKPEKTLEDIRKVLQKLSS